MALAQLDNAISCVSSVMGSRKGNLTSAFSAVKASSARGPAFSHASFLAGKISPSMLRWPRVGRSLCWAMHSQTTSGAWVSKLSSGKPALQNWSSLFLPFRTLGRHDGNERRSPVLGSSVGLTNGWMWWFLCIRLCCNLASYWSNHVSPEAAGVVQKSLGNRGNVVSLAYEGHAFLWHRDFL